MSTLFSFCPIEKLDVLFWMFNKSMVVKILLTIVDNMLSAAAKERGR